MVTFQEIWESVPTGQICLEKIDLRFLYKDWEY